MTRSDTILTHLWRDFDTILAYFWRNYVEVVSEARLSARIVSKWCQKHARTVSGWCQKCATPKSRWCRNNVRRMLDVTVMALAHYQIVKWKSAIYMSLKHQQKRQSYVTYAIRLPQTCQLKHYLNVTLMLIEYNITNVRNESFIRH